MRLEGTARRGGRRCGGWKLKGGRCFVLKEIKSDRVQRLVRVKEIKFRGGGGRS